MDNANSTGIKQIIRIVIVFLCCFLPTFLYSGIGYLVSFLVVLVLAISQGLGNGAYSHSALDWYNTHLMDIQAGLILVAIPIMLMLWYFVIRYFKNQNMYIKYGPSNRFTYFLLIPVGYSSMMFGNLFTAIIQKNLMTQEMVDNYNETDSVLHMGSKVAVVLAAVILAPVVEEIIYRGIIYDFANYMLNYKYAIVFSALVFAIGHGNMVQGVYTLTLGLIFGYVRYKYGNIYTTIFMHMLANGVATGVYYISTDTEVSEQSEKVINETTQMIVQIIYTVRYGIILAVMLFLIHKFVKRKEC